MKKLLLTIVLILFNSVANADTVYFGPASTTPLMKEVEIVERHLHSGASWFGAAVTPSGTDHVADRIGPGVGAFQLDVGNETWGAWVQILGPNDTPARADQVYFDPHQIYISDGEEQTTYFIQFTRGTVAQGAAASYTAGRYTELVIGIDATKKFKTITSIQTGRAPVDSALWARCLAVGYNTGTLDFYLGVHEYDE